MLKLIKQMVMSVKKARREKGIRYSLYTCAVWLLILVAYVLSCVGKVCYKRREDLLIEAVAAFVAGLLVYLITRK